MPYHLYISTGETSGEQHAARLVRALFEQAIGSRFSAMGGDILRDAGARIVVDAERLRVMGFAELISHWKDIKAAFHGAVETIVREKPDAVILVDYPGFHLRLAKALKKRLPGTPILYYIAPKAWAWNERRVRVLAKYVDRLLCILPFEEKWFGKRGVAAQYVGNPVFDAVREAPDGSALRAELQLDADAHLISLFPGSREKEVRRMLPGLVESARLLESRLKAEARHLHPVFAVAAAPGMSRDMLGRMADLPATMRVVEGRGTALLAASHFGLLKSGTTTLEAALLGVPMVALYRTSPVSAWIARRVFRGPYWTLPNILAERELIPELFQDAAEPGRVARQAAAILADEARYDAMRADLLSLRAHLGEAPAAARTAEEILEFLRQRVPNGRKC